MTLGLVAAVASVAPGAAGAVEVSELLGRWGGDVFHAYDCKGEPGTEIMPVTVSREADGRISVGAYAWLCSAGKWEERGAFLAADVTCGNEGTDEISSEHLELALSTGGQLVLATGPTVTVLTRCPAEVQ
jgi:hypothetical protein